MYPVSQGSAGGGATGSSRSSKVISAVLIVLCMTDKAGCGAWRGRVHSLVTLLSGVFMGAAQGPLPQATSSRTFFRASPHLGLGAGLAIVTQALVWRSADSFSTCPL